MNYLKDYTRLNDDLTNDKHLNSLDMHLSKVQDTLKKRKAVLVKDFLEWYLSDENDEGCSITQTAVNHYSDAQIRSIKHLFDACVVLPERITIGYLYYGIPLSERGDYDVKDLELIRKI